MTAAPTTGFARAADRDPAIDQTAIDRTATALVAARRAADGIDAFPGALPSDLAAAYAVQNAAIAQWPQPVAGWKIARVPPALEDALGTLRYAGPVFAETVVDWTGAPLALPVIAGGFGAVEAEFMVRVAIDAPADRSDFTPDEVGAYVGAVHAGIEMAGNAVAPVMTLGPLAAIASFGNNLALIIGPKVADDLDGLASVQAETEIDGQSVGTGHGDKLPGGVATAMAFALNVTAKLGHPLKAGQWVSTGALTGVHAIGIGQAVRIAFTGIEPMTGETVAAQPAG